MVEFFVRLMYCLSMKLLNLQNAFHAPIYHEEIVSSTFDTARILAAQGTAHGTVIAADFQEAGRGRFRPESGSSRPWESEKGKNLMFTILLRCGDLSSLSPALTLKTGLAVSMALEDLCPALCGLVKVKWPNDVMIGPFKIAGILAEAGGNYVYIGVGVNVAQIEFPDDLRSKALSLIHANPDLNEESRFILLEKILCRLYNELEKTPGPFKAGSGSYSAAPCNTGPSNTASWREPGFRGPASWRERLIERLYKKNEPVIFSEGAADSHSSIEGILSGIGEGGEILIIPKGEKKELAFVTGELKVY